MNYNADAPKSTEPSPEGAGWIARYAWSGTAEHPPASTAGPEEVQRLRPTDYHEVLLERLHQVEATVLGVAGDVPIQTRCYVDTGPVVERFFAQIAGTGWIGKNTCVLNQQKGSFLLLGVVLTSMPLAGDALLAPAPDRCGSCTRCIDACPTDALIAPHQMDATRCIAYLTIEKKGGLPEELRAYMGRQVFGCDICQDVCPWNRRAPIATDPQMLARRDLVNPQLEALAAMDAPAFRAAFRGSPLERTGRRRLQRNVAIAMGNSRDPRHLPRLSEWAGGEDQLLAAAARWALLQLNARATVPASSPRSSIEKTDPHASPCDSN